MLEVQNVQRSIKIVSTGSYVPRTRVTSSDIDLRLEKKPGWSKRLFCIDTRYYADADESTSYMAAEAAKSALEKAGLRAADIDCIVSACGVGEQPIPSTAILVQKKLGLGDSGVAAFDVNSTCLSFVTALDVVADAISAGRYRTVLIVSADIASCGLDWSNPEAAAIFGDGAAAVIVSKSGNQESSRMIASRMESYSSFQDVCRLEAGGTRLRANRANDAFWDATTFKMDGRAALACALKYLPGFLEKLSNSAAHSISDLDLLILHQASHHALAAVQQHLGFAPEKVVHIFKDFGNQIATSIPHALNVAITRGQLKRGNKFMLLGTSAGISIGGAILEY